jgi:hypothetical protein
MKRKTPSKAYIVSAPGPDHTHVVFAVRALNTTDAFAVVASVTGYNPESLEIVGILSRSVVKNSI